MISFKWTSLCNASQSTAYKYMYVFAKFLSIRLFSRSSLLLPRGNLHESRHSCTTFFREFRIFLIPRTVNLNPRQILRHDDDYDDDYRNGRFQSARERRLAWSIPLDRTFASVLHSSTPRNTSFPAATRPIPLSR